MGGIIPELKNERWTPVHEAYGTWEEWIEWKQDSALMALFHDGVL